MGFKEIFASWSRTAESDYVGRLQHPDGGFTLDVNSGKEPTEGYVSGIKGAAPRVLHHTEVTPDELASHRQQVASHPGATHQGGWHDPETGLVHLDSVRVFHPSERDKAIEFGKANDQISIWDLAKNEAINTGGKGEG